MHTPDSWRRFLAHCQNPLLPDLFSRHWLRIKPDFTQILRHAASVVFIDDPSFISIDEVFEVLVRKGVLEQEGPFVTAALALMVLRRGTHSPYIYGDREARDLRLLAPWVDKRWRHGQRYSPEVLAVRIQAMQKKLASLLDEHFPRGKQDQWFVHTEPKSIPRMGSSRMTLGTGF